MTSSETKYIVSKVKYMMPVINVPPSFLLKYHIPLYLTFALKRGAGLDRRVYFSGPTFVEGMHKN